MADQGFSPVVLAGQAATAPRLLSRQVVVAGISDGVIQGPPPSHVLKQLRATVAPPPDALLTSYQSLPLRDSLPAGACSRHPGSDMLNDLQGVCLFRS